MRWGLGEGLGARWTIFKEMAYMFGTVINVKSTGKILLTWCKTISVVLSVYM